jgi:hypothetical protein
MFAAYLSQATAGTEEAITVARTLSFAAISLGAAVLIYYLAIYIREILVPACEDRWRYLVIGVAAAIVYGLSGLAEVLSPLQTASGFRIGATLFFFLFSAVGVRALYMTVKLDRGGGGLDADSPSDWVWYAIIGGFIVAWWGAYLLGPPTLVALVNTVGLAGAVTYTLAYAILAVRDAEGTSVAAVVRQFVPALISFAVVVLAEQAGQHVGVDPGIVVGIELVGTALVGAFLFTTAVAIRQQSGEVTRMYDRTTWRKQELE